MFFGIYATTKYTPETRCSRRIMIRNPLQALRRSTDVYTITTKFTNNRQSKNKRRIENKASNETPAVANERDQYTNIHT